MVARERFALIDLIGMIVAYGGFFLAASQSEQTPLSLVILFAIATAVRLTVMAGAYLTLSAEARAEMHARPDERDRAVSLRAALAAYYVLLLAMIVVVFKAFSDDGLDVAMVGLAGLVAADMVRTATIVASYRWGWRG